MSAPTDDAVGRVAKELDRQRSWGGMAWVDAPRVSVPTDALRAVLARLAECEADAVRLYDILMQVSKVTPGESRHESAKRIIRQHEDVCSQSGPVAAREGVGHG